MLSSLDQSVNIEDDRGCWQPQAKRSMSPRRYCCMQWRSNGGLRAPGL